jgi:peptidoglycan/LPS O-acetylase OafA/YrhL
MSDNIQNKTKQSKLLFLDGMRGLAALYVMIGHARWLLWEGYQNFNIHPNDYSLIDKALMYFFSLFKWGHEFVLLFFVLSGFVIHYGYCSKLKLDKAASLNFAQYFSRRTRRIYPPFLLALLLTFALDYAGQMLNYSIYTGSSPYELMNTHVGNTSHDLKTLIGNVFFLYKDYVPIFGSNGPTWSLKFEWWFYMFYPVFLIISRKHIYYSTALVAVLFAASFFPDLWPSALLQEIFGSMICWWLGVLLAEVYTKRIPVKSTLLSLVAFLWFLFLFAFNTNSVVYDLQIAFLFTSILGIFLWLNDKNYNLNSLKRLKTLGDFSYTLYIIHFPILCFLSGAVMKNSASTLPKHSYFILTGSFVCVTISYLFHFIVEVPFTRKSKKAITMTSFSGSIKLIRSYVKTKK